MKRCLYAYDKAKDGRKVKTAGFRPLHRGEPKNKPSPASTSEDKGEAVAEKSGHVSAASSSHSSQKRNGKNPSIEGLGAQNYTSVNPARSTGPALFVGGWALSQLWLFWLAPIVGAALAGLTYKKVSAEY